MPGRIVATDLKTGAIAWASDIGGTHRSELLLRRNEILIVTEAAGRSATLRSVSLNTGLPLWNLELGHADRYFLFDSRGAAFVASVTGDFWAVRDGVIVRRGNLSASILRVPDVPGSRFVFATSKPSVDIYEPAEGRRLSSVAMDFKPSRVSARSETIFVSDDRGTLVAFGESGRQRWSFRTGGKIHYLDALESALIVGSADNFVYALSPDSGGVKWKRRLPGRVASGGVVHGNQIAMTVVGEPSAYVIDVSDGRIVDQLRLGEREAFLLTPVKADGVYLLAATTSGLSAWSRSCNNEKGDHGGRL